MSTPEQRERIIDHLDTLKNRKFYGARYWLEDIVMEVLAYQKREADSHKDPTVKDQ